MVRNTWYFFTVLCAISIACLIGCGGSSFDGPAYMNPNLPTTQRVDDLVGRMTLEQKAGQMVNSAPAIDSLHIDQYDWWNEALHGVAVSGIATVFPQAIGLAAMWDDDQIFEMTTVVSDEARAKYNEAIRNGNHGRFYGLTFWSPNINIFRDPRWGRGQETYGEDPYLSGRLAVQFVKGMQGDDPRYLKVVSTLKHYAVHSGPEPERHTFDAQASDRDLYETYLPHFRDGIIEGGAYSVMGAYNRFRGESASASQLLLVDILRDRWGFDGYLVSDCGAIDDIFVDHKIVETAAEATALAIKTGMDLNCGSIYYSVDRQTGAIQSAIVDAVEQGLLTEDEVDVSLKRLMTARMKLGMFDPPEMVPWSDMPYSVNDSPEHARLAEKIARKSIVLLKNEDNALPLSKNLGTIAVIGPNADDTQVLHGNYNGTASDPVSALRGIREKVGDSLEVLYARGCNIAEGMVTYEPVPASAVAGDVTVEFFDNLEFEGDPVRTETSDTIGADFGNHAPHPELTDNQFAVRWTGEISVPETGEYAIQATGWGSTLTLDGEQIGGGFGFGRGATPRFITLEADRTYPVVLQRADRFGGFDVSLQWAMQGRDFAAEAVAVAEQADAVVLVMGISASLEGEEMNVQVEGFSGGDRTAIGLPQIQRDLMQQIVAVGKPTVLVLMNGSALAVNWANENIPAIVESWYGGQAAGTAIADVLFGDYNPAGRLPVTFYKSVDDLPDFRDYSMANRTYKYFTGDPLYPFGHGLSYTTFEYSDLKLPEQVNASQPAVVTVTVTNTGDHDGDEVVQLYVTDPEASVPVPLRRLADFERITLAAGESQTVTLTINPREMSVITDDTRRMVELGAIDVWVGGKQPGFTGTADTWTSGIVNGSFEVVGVPTEIML